jgi:uncharacterized protein (TIRG00374 family)
MLSIFLIESLVIFRTFKMSNTNLSFRQALGTYFFGCLGSNITPMKSGHFPLKFYYFSRNKVSFEKSLGIICLNQIIYSSTTIFTYFLLFIFCAVKNTSIVVLNITVYLKYIALIGLVFNIGTMTLVLLMSFNKKFHSLIIRLCAWFLFKFKKITSKEEYAESQREKMLIYKNQILYFVKHFYKFLPSILMYFVFLLLICGTPYVIYLFLTNSTFNISDYLFFFSLNQTMSYITNVIPVPGGTGVAEITFLTIFGLVYPENLIGTGMVIWRVFTYYMPTLIAFLVFVIFMVKKRNEERISLKETEKTPNPQEPPSN